MDVSYHLRLDVPEWQQSLSASTMDLSEPMLLDDIKAASTSTSTSWMSSSPRIQDSIPILFLIHCRSPQTWHTRPLGQFPMLLASLTHVVNCRLSRQYPSPKVNKMTFDSESHRAAAHLAAMCCEQLAHLQRPTPSSSSYPTPPTPPPFGRRANHHPDETKTFPIWKGRKNFKRTVEREMWGKSTKQPSGVTESLSIAKV